MGKSTKGRVKQTNRQTKLFVFAVVVVTAMIVVVLSVMTTTRATLKDDDYQANNFSYGDVTTELVEEFEPPENLPVGKPYTKKVSVKNSGELPAFVRVLVSVEVLGKAETEGVPILLPGTIGKEVNLLNEKGAPIQDDENWVDGKDGFYYYLKAIEPGQTTPSLFESVEARKDMIKDNPLYDEARLDIHVKTEGIHTTKWAYRDAWWSGEIPTDGALVNVETPLKSLAE